MPRKTKLIRILSGAALLLALLIAGFAITMPLMHHAGATAAEADAAYPGDEYAPHPTVEWTVAETIHAPASQVYAWLIQIGDTRAGFYSYMFIERLFGPGLYHNAERIHPEWQNPAPGEGMIADIVALHDFKAGSYVTAKDTPKLGGMTWVWTWMVTPVDGQHSRLVNRFRIQTPASMALPPILVDAIDLGGFVMEQNMMQGIAQRAEGRGELSFTEPLEIFFWLAALGAGLAGAWAFINRAEWRKALGVCILAVAGLFVLTFVQPDLWVRALIDLALIAGSAWAIRPEVTTRPAAVQAVQG